MPLGVIFIENSPVLFRACTPAYRHPIVRVDNKGLVEQLFKGPISRRLQNDLMPTGSFHIGGIHEFSQYPQDVSYKHLVREIGSALSHKMLDESTAQEILQERIYTTLFYKPSSWIQGDDLPQDHYWKLMGYENIQEAEDAKISDLIRRVNELITRFRSRMEKHDNLFTSYSLRFDQLFALHFALSLLNQDDHLGHPSYSNDKLWGYLRDQSEPFMEEVKKLIPCIIRNYKILFS